MEQLYTKHYQVAEHIFEVQSNNVALLKLMTNYQSFDITSSCPSHAETIFKLHIEHSGLLHQEQINLYTHLFTDYSEAEMPRIEVYYTKDSGDWLMRVAQVADSPICCELESNKNFTQGRLYIASDYNDIRFCIDNALMLMYAFRTASLMTLEMHAAVVVKKDYVTDNHQPPAKSIVNILNGGLKDSNSKERGYIFLGHSGTGKSTHARQWLQTFSDAWLLNDDNPILRVMDDGEVRVYGSPWSGKTPCYKNAYVRVGGIVKLSQAPHNTLRPLTLPQAYAYILSSASGLKMIPQMADDIYESIKYIITHVRCYHLDCLPNTDAAITCWNEIKGNSL